MMTDAEKARRLFEQAGLAFPEISPELAARLKERDRWLFSTRDLDVWPYDLKHYVDEVDGAPVADYALLSHSGHGVNSYAVQYYLVFGPLRVFLHLGWGGVYMDADTAAANIRECFSLADQIVARVVAGGRVEAGGKLTVVCSDFYGSYWSGPGLSTQPEAMGRGDPATVLGEVLDWLGPGGTA